VFGERRIDEMYSTTFTVFFLLVEGI
jgi:hypothetical protein